MKMNGIVPILILSILIANDVRAESAEMKSLCSSCDGGQQDSCDKLVELNAEKGENVCDPPKEGDQNEGEYNPDMFEGDIVSSGISRAATSRAGAKWPGGIVHYKMGNFTNSQKSMIIAAMKHIESKTCIRFKERTNEVYYVKIGNDKSGCFSAAGRAHKYNQPQTLNLASKCLRYIGTPAHEMMHTLGFFHEQSRPDRDDYITIDFENVRKPSQFRKESTALTQNTKYDYGSVMHYGAYAFSINHEKPTIVPKQKGVTLGQRDGLSETDAWEINHFYNDCKNDE